jgi:hypothetical protein
MRFGPAVGDADAMDGEDLIKDEFGPTDESGKRLTTWYAQGHSDGLGDRLLMFDNTSAPSWEILRFKPDLAADARFETELRHRVDQLSSFRNPAFPMVRPITELDLDEDLAVVSTYASGVSLSDGLKKPRSAMFAVRLLRQLVPAVAALQQHGPGISHGAITLERLVLTAEGRLMVREHMVGSAIERLLLSPMTLWSEFGLLAPPSSGAVSLGPRCDVVQMALAALSLMTGRRIGRDEYPDRVPELLDTIEDRSLWHEPETFRSLRAWLERALQLGDRVFDSAGDAYAALSELKEEPPRRSDHPSLYLAQGRPPQEAPPPPPSPPLSPPPPSPGTASLRVPDAMYDVTPVGLPPRRTIGAWLRDARVLRWAATVVGVFALGEAAFIGRLLLPDWSDRAKPATPAVSTPSPRPDTAPSKGDPASSDRPELTPLSVDAPPPTTTAIVPSLAVASASPSTIDLPPASASAPQRSGGIRVSAPVEVHVLDGERLLGSSADGPIIAAAGRHEFEFVNSAIGYRTRRVVDVKAGEITPVSVAVPDGVLNINAVPWAAVWIDGTSYGETPIGNLSIAPGEHEVVFRHPQFGERREKAVVRAETTTRVAVNFRN